MNLIIALVVIFLHFVVARIGDFPLTPASFVLITFFGLVFNVRGFFLCLDIKRVVILGVAVLYPWLIWIFIVHPSVDLSGFLHTYALWMFSLFSVSFGAWAPIKALKGGGTLTPAITLSSAIIFAIVLAQFVAASFGSDMFFNLLGDYQYYGVRDLRNFMGSSGVVRPHGLYLEPSFCAFVCFALLAMNVVTPNGKRYVTMLLFGAILLIQSAAGLAALGLLTAVYFSAFSSGAGAAIAQQANSQTAAKVARALVGLLLIMSVMSFSHFGLFDRFAQVSVEGSSSYYRVAAPAEALASALDISPFGLPFGTIETFMLTLGFSHGQGFGTSLDNGYYVMLYYFGIPGVLALFYLGWRIVHWVEVNQGLRLMLLCALAVLPLFNGGVFLPEFALMVVLIIYVYRVRRIYEFSATHNLLDFDHQR